MNGQYGAPGIGGSLGECAVCAKPFISELLLNTAAASFKVSGISQTLYAHKQKCVPLLKECAGDKWRNLPAESVIRKAFEEHEKEMSVQSDGDD